MTRKTVLFAAIALFVVWAATNMRRISSDDDALIRVVLISIFAVLILLRPKPEREQKPHARFRLPGLHGTALSLVTGVGGALLSLAGIIFSVHQFEWLGLVLLLYACLRWALPRPYRRDLILALFLLYWMHPIPGQIFGRFQLWMQLISVQGAEALLYCINMPVWAEGFYLRTGLLTLGIPEACSGMRTVVTVSLCTLGVGMLLRMRWYESIVLLVGGVVQVVAFNIVRIAAVVIMAPRMPREWAETVLHDTLGFFLLFAILAVQLEVSAWKIYRDKRRRLREGIDSGNLERPDRGRALPGPWRLVLHVWKPVLLIGLLGLGVAYAVFQQRPGHRLGLMRPVIDMLMENEVEAANAAIMEGLASFPDDRDLLTKRAHVLLVKADYRASLALIDSLAPPLEIVEVVMRSRALMSLGRVDEAFASVKELSERAGDRPGVAMIMAEYAAVKDLPDDVNQSIVIAARSHLVQNRVRALFPYLALREQWKTIAQCDNSNVPYADVGPALVAVQAHLHTRDMARAAEIMKGIVETDPNDPRFLSSLFSLALSQRDSQWEELFTQNLGQNVSKLDADRLASYIDYSFRLGRPDLAWLAWRYLQSRDASDPALFLSLARFYDVWFMFRRHALLIEAESSSDRIDLESFYHATHNLPPFDAFWNVVPQAATVASAPDRQGRDAQLALYFDEMDRRAAAGTLNERMEMSFAPALGLAGRYKEAHAQLVEMESKYPEKKRDILYQRAVLYNQRGRWQMLYETMVEYRALSNYQPRLGADLMFINAMMNMNMGAASMAVAAEAERLYPGSESVHAALAAIWDVFRYKDQALFTLSQGDADPRVVVQLLYDTGRFNEAEQMSNAMGVGITRNALGETQRLVPPRAELALAKRWPKPLDADGFDAEVLEYEADIARSTSPYIVALRGASRDWARARGEGDVSDVVVWSAMGRNRLESAGALHQLAMLLARQERYEEASGAIEAAIALLPESAVLRRIQMVLAVDPGPAIKEGRASCPDDPEIWLAELVHRTRSEGKGDWAADMIKAAVLDNRFSAETFSRAGDFLLRAGMVDEAAAAARHAISISRTLLTPYVLGIRCGLTLREFDWALSCALAGSEYARDPTPFFKTVVMLKWARNSRDTDVIKALQYLQQHDPNAAVWAERLGFVYFEKRDTRRALNVLGPVIDKDRSKVRLQSLLMAAESARIEGDQVKAIEILEAAYSMYPDRINILNNLIYTLLEHKGSLARAKELLPQLLAMGDDSFPVLDTAAMVYLRNGQVDRARDFMTRAMSLLEQDHYATLEVTLNAAEIFLLSGQFEEAASYLDAVWEFTERSATTDNRAKALLKRLQETRPK
ncbi:MAG: archaeosortase/exosortase family protein [Lentisphaerae bacterium]|nr:archaeosortase/exosortase family protein [Lentisphaerota bacterium]